MYHQKSMPYHPQENGIMEAFKKFMENALTNICNAKLNEWDVHIPTILWAYRTTCKNLIGKMPFIIVYGKEAMILMDYVMPSLWISIVIDMADLDTMEE